MNKGRVYFIAVTILLIATAVFIIHGFYTERYAVRKLNAVINLFTATDSISYGEIFYNIKRDEVHITNMELIMKTGGIIKAKDITIDSVYDNVTHKVTVKGFEYTTNNSHMGVLKTDKIVFEAFNIVSFIDFLTRVQNAKQVVLFPSWIKAPFDMESCDIYNLNYVQNDGCWFKIANLGWKGTMIKGEIPQQIDFYMNNMHTTTGPLKGLLGADNISIPSGKYSRTYDKDTKVYSEKLEDVIVENMLTISARLELSNVNPDNLLESYYIGKNIRQKFISDTNLDSADVATNDNEPVNDANIDSLNITIRDKGLVNKVSSSIKDVTMLDGKAFAKIWLLNELPKLIPTINHNDELAEQLVIFLNNPDVLTINVNPIKPIPVIVLEDKNSRHLDELNISIKINSLPPVVLTAN